MRHIRKIILHCSASSWGDRKIIKLWHLDKGFADIGYHYVMGNGFPDSSGRFFKEWDGLIEDGRPLEIPGAHVKGENDDSIGICLIGNHTFTAKQLWVSLPDLTYKLMKKFDLSLADIYGHYEFNQNKSCPNFKIKDFRRFLGDYINNQLVPL